MEMAKGAPPLTVGLLQQHHLDILRSLVRLQPGEIDPGGMIVGVPCCSMLGTTSPEDLFNVFPDENRIGIEF